MKTTLRSFILAILFLLFQNIEAQKANYTTRQGMTIGFGVGGAYQQSDIANSNGMGYDFTLGSQLYKREGAFLSADWKFRFLAGENKAYDHRINTDGSYSNLNYKFFNYDLELGLSLNRLREKTRIVVTGFAGAGITHGRSFIDEIDENSAIYDFSSIDQNQDQKQIYADLMALSDNDFETLVNNKAAILPTAGIFIGYQFSHSFSMGIEHKTNFSLSEQNSLTGINMDNNIYSGSGIDKNHYTTLGFKWNLGRRSSSGSYSGGRESTTYNPIVASPPSNNTTVIPNTVTTVSKNPPRVEIIDPETSPYRTPESYITIKASIFNADGYNEISFFQDGNKKNNFTYNSYTHILSIGVNLHEGDNSFRIVATNSGGTAQARLIVILNKSVTIVPAPIVNFTSPTVSRYNSNSDMIEIAARVKNVTYKEDIELILNGRSIVFDYRPGDGTLRATVYLQEGANALNISASNATGTARDQMELNYNRVIQEVAPPVLQFINPTSPINITNNIFLIKARTENIFSWNDLTLSVNGTINNNFNFSNTGEISANIALAEGLNTIEITGRNESGQRSVKTYITNTKPVRIAPPTIYVFSPTENPYRSYESTVEVRASISNVMRRADIIFSVNRQSTENYSFNGNTGELVAKVGLKEGQNVVTITGQNEVGRDVASLNIVKEIKPCPTPEIILPIAGREMLTADIQSFTLRAELKNIDSRNQLQLTLNRVQVPFNFNGNTLSCSTSLNPGINNFVVEAKTECGEDIKMFSVKYTPAADPLPCLNPVVNFSLIPVNRADATHELRGTVSNMKSKSGLRLIVNGSNIDNYQFNSATGAISGSYNFNVGKTTVVINARNECGDDSKTVSVTVSKEVEVKPCLPPEVSFNMIPVDRPGLTHDLRGTVSNLKTKSGLLLIVNGNSDDNFQFNPATGAMSGSFNFNPGKTTVVLNARNECGSDSKSVSVSIEEPCNPPKVELSLTAVNTPDATHMLRASISHVKNKSDISVTVNGKADQGFQFVPGTGALTGKYKFSPGATTVVVAVKNACGSDSKSVSVSIEEPCQPPKVELSLTAVNTPDATHMLRASISHVKNKSDISVTVNGKADQGFQFAPGTGALTGKYKFSPGATTVVVAVKNECGSDSKSASVSIEEPCNPPKVELSLTAVNTTDATHMLRASISHVKNKSDISVTVNGKADQGFQFVPGTGALTGKYKFSPGATTVVVAVKNECGSDSKSASVSIEVEDKPEEPSICGIRINPGNSEWQFCLQTPRGTFNRQNLENMSFSYSGSATSLYFMPIAGGGDALVNGKPYKMKSGSYYLFTGKLTVKVSSKNPGSMGQWSVCIESDKMPITGNGSNRPKSPCESE